MNLSNVALAAYLSLAAIMAPVPTQAELVLPSLSKNGKQAEIHHFDTSLSFKTKDDLDWNSEQLAMVEEAFLLSCNEVHDPKKYHGEEMKIEEVSHGPSLKVNNQNNLRGEIQFSKWYRALISSQFGVSCRMCGPDDDDSLMASMVDAGNGGRVREWEKTLCDILSKYPAFDGIKDCNIDVKWKEEESLGMDMGYGEE